MLQFDLSALGIFTYSARYVINLFYVRVKSGFMVMSSTKKLKGNGLEAELLMIRVLEMANHLRILLITASRCFCGACNTCIIMKTKEAHSHLLNKEGTGSEFFVVGKKRPNLLKTCLAPPDAELSYSHSFFDLLNMITAASASRIRDIVPQEAAFRVTSKAGRLSVDSQKVKAIKAGKIENLPCSVCLLR